MSVQPGNLCGAATNTHRKRSGASPGHCGQEESFGAAPAGHSDWREGPEPAPLLQVVKKDTTSARGEATHSLASHVCVLDDAVRLR